MIFREIIADIFHPFVCVCVCVFVFVWITYLLLDSTALWQP